MPGKLLRKVSAEFPFSGGEYSIYLGNTRQPAGL
jgi:hypothetical protein